MKGSFWICETVFSDFWTRPPPMAGSFVLSSHHKLSVKCPILLMTPPSLALICVGGELTRSTSLSCWSTNNSELKVLKTGEKNVLQQMTFAVCLLMIPIQRENEKLLRQMKNFNLKMLDEKHCHEKQSNIWNCGPVSHGKPMHRDQSKLQRVVHSTEESGAAACLQDEEVCSHITVCYCHHGHHLFQSLPSGIWNWWSHSNALLKDPLWSSH